MLQYINGKFTIEKSKSVSIEYRSKSMRRGAQLMSIGFPTLFKNILIKQPIWYDQKLKHFDDISLGELFVRIRVVIY